jgi:hypothetical protein
MNNVSQERLSNLDLAIIVHELRKLKDIESPYISRSIGIKLFDEVMSLRAERDRYKAALEDIKENVATPWIVDIAAKALEGDDSSGS